MCIDIEETILPTTTVDCTPTAGSTTTYNETNKRITVTLQNSSTGSPISNAGATIDVTLYFELTNECGVQSYYTEVLSITGGNSQATLDYVAVTTALCSGTGQCGTVTRILGCVQSITGQTVPLCAGVSYNMCAQP